MLRPVESRLWTQHPSQKRLNAAIESAPFKAGSFQ